MLGNQRRPDESCAPSPVPIDPGEGDREVRHAAGSTVVRAEPQKIVVLSGDQLDALCALGLQSRIVAAALPDGSDSQPSYLGAVVHDLPSVGTRSSPDLAAIRAAQPDLILGSEALTPDAHSRAVGHRPDGVHRCTGSRVAGQPPDGRRCDMARGGAANGLIDEFNAAADKEGADNDAPHFRHRSCSSPTPRCGSSDRTASPAVCWPTSAWIALRHNVLPISRMTRSASPTRISDNSPDFSIADGDIVYVSFASPAAKDRAGDVMGSDAWRKLSANKDNRVFVVNNEVWQTGEGIVAARGDAVRPALAQRTDQLTSTS